MSCLSLPVTETRISFPARPMGVKVQINAEEEAIKEKGRKWFFDTMTLCEGWEPDYGDNKWMFGDLSSSGQIAPKYIRYLYNVYF